MLKIYHEISNWIERFQIQIVRKNWIFNWSNWQAARAFLVMLKFRIHSRHSFNYLASHWNQLSIRSHCDILPFECKLKHETPLTREFFCCVWRAINLKALLNFLQFARNFRYENLTQNFISEELEKLKIFYFQTHRILGSNLIDKLRIFG